MVTVAYLGGGSDVLHNAQRYSLKCNKYKSNFSLLGTLNTDLHLSWPFRVILQEPFYRILLKDKYCIFEFSK